MVNSLFMLACAPIQFVFGYILTETTRWENLHHWGAIQWILPGHCNIWIELLITLVVLDFTEYIYHVVMHKTKFLWMFHLVHHTDRVVDTSTTLREHPGETFFRLMFACAVAFILGASFWAIVLRQFIQITANVFVHSNFRLPEKVDKIARKFFITPNLHHVHHHYKQPYTDSNYGDIFSIWDRMFGTFRLLSVADTEFGVDTHMELHENSNFKSLIQMPFGEYRHSPLLLEHKPDEDKK